MVRRESRAQKRHAANIRGKMMNKASLKKMATSAALILGVIIVDQKWGLTTKIRSMLGL